MIASVGLIGDPVAHSISPMMHNAAFAACGLPDVYELWLTPAADLAERVAFLRRAGMRGANVTIPHKQAVVPLLDACDAEALAVGAVNTIVRTADERLLGSNTDVPGFLRALATIAFEPRGRSVVLLGAGGAARAVAFGLIQAGVQSLVVANRTVDRAEMLLADMLAATDADPLVLAVKLDDPDLAEYIRAADLLVNATSVGLHSAELPVAATLIAAHLLVVDLIYRSTPFLQLAAERGARTQDGLEMLVQQGALSFERWTGMAAPLDVMRAAARQALKERT